MWTQTADLKVTMGLYLHQGLSETNYVITGVGLHQKNALLFDSSLPLMFHML